jgi:hypothetical protein
VSARATERASTRELQRTGDFARKTVKVKNAQSDARLPHVRSRVLADDVLWGAPSRSAPRALHGIIPRGTPSLEPPPEAPLAHRPRPGASPSRAVERNRARGATRSRRRRRRRAWRATDVARSEHGGTLFAAMGRESRDVAQVEYSCAGEGRWRIREK